MVSRATMEKCEEVFPFLSLLSTFHFPLRNSQFNPIKNLLLAFTDIEQRKKGRKKSDDDDLSLLWVALSWGGSRMPGYGNGKIYSNFYFNIFFFLFCVFIRSLLVFLFHSIVALFFPSPSLLPRLPHSIASDRRALSVSSKGG